MAYFNKLNTAIPLFNSENLFIKLIQIYLKNLGIDLIYQEKQLRKSPIELGYAWQSDYKSYEPTFQMATNRSNHKNFNWGDKNPIQAVWLEHSDLTALPNGALDCRFPKGLTLKGL